jgi:hypothetical protein
MTDKEIATRRIIESMSPEQIGGLCKRFREEKLKVNVPFFAKRTKLSTVSIYNFESGKNVSYISFYEYVKVGFLEWMETE